METWYRYQYDAEYSKVVVKQFLLGVNIRCFEFPVIKHTPKGVWLHICCSKKVWVSNTAKKRFAYPTKQLALNSFKIRMIYYKRHLE